MISALNRSVDGDSEENIPVEESSDEMREREDNNYGEDQEDE